MRVNEARERALSVALAPLLDWASGLPSQDEPGRGLPEALDLAIREYWRFLDERPSFARLVAWEALEGAQRLADAGGQSAAVSDVFRAVHASRIERGLGEFDPVLVSVALVSLAFLPVANAATFARGSDLDTRGNEFREPYRRLVVGAVLHLLGCGE